MPGESTNVTTMWTPNRGYDSGWLSGGPTTAFGANNAQGVPQNVQTSPWMINNPNAGQPGQPATIQDPGATAQAQGGSWTGLNGLQTTGIMNPFGLVWNGSQNTGFVPGANPQNNASAPINPFLPQITQTNTPATPNSTSITPDNSGSTTPPISGARNNSWNMSQSTNPPVTNTGFSQNTSNPADVAGFRNSFTQGNPISSGPINTVRSRNASTYVDPTQTTQTTNPTTMYDSSGNTVTWDGTKWVSAATGVPAVSSSNTQSTATQNTNTPFTPGYLQNITSGYLDQNGNQQYAPTNPLQFADPATAQAMANYLGSGVSQLQLGGPGMGFSTPMAQVGPNGSMNAGLAANELKQEGSGPGSMGAYLLARDQANASGVMGFPSYDAWASTQPGYNPGGRAVNNYDTAGNNAAFMQNPQQFMSQQNQGNIGQNFGQPLSLSPQNQFYGQPQNNQPAGLYNNIYSQLAPILSILQLLGLFGNGGQGQQLNTYQPPPPLPQNSLYGFPFYSQFA